MRVLAMLLGLVGGLPPLVIALQLWTDSDWRLIIRRAVLRAALAAAASLSIVGAADVLWRPMAAASLMNDVRWYARAYHGLAALEV